MPKLDEFVDEVIEMEPCNHKAYEYLNGWDLGATLFCPKYGENDILKGDYYSEKASWLRFIVHRCDPNDTVMIDGELKNKRCASRDE